MRRARLRSDRAHPGSAGNDGPADAPAAALVDLHFSLQDVMGETVGVFEALRQGGSKCPALRRPDCFSPSPLWGEGKDEGG
jgi:hypothetical protein